jgi:hypothetical protein
VYHPLQEQALNNDIVQEDFLDTYRNLTFKTVSGLKWVTRYCRQARYTLKIDDHVFVNMFNLLNVLFEMPFHPAYILGYVRFHEKVLRTGRWGVLPEQWSTSQYPIFIAGPAYVISTDLVEQLYFASYHVPFFWLEDVYATGLLPLLIPSTPKFVQWVGRYTFFTSSFVQDFTGSPRTKHLFAHVRTTSIYPSVWQRILTMDLSDHIMLAKFYKARMGLHSTETKTLIPARSNTESGKSSNRTNWSRIFNLFSNSR